jgi:hypothetical protein
MLMYDCKPRSNRTYDDSNHVKRAGEHRSDLGEL